MATAARTRIMQCVTVLRPAYDLYQYWRDLKHMPRLVPAVESVQFLDETRSIWTAQVPGGAKVQWYAQITEDVPGEIVAWSSTKESDVENSGSVQFLPAPGDKGTVVKVEMEYDLPAGALGEALATLFGENPSQQTREGLRRFKMEMETGEIPTIEGQPRGRCR